MLNSVSKDVRFYPGISPTIIENHTNSEAEQFRNKINDEIKFKQAYVRMEFLKNTLEKYNGNFTQPQKNVLNAELNDAQRELALLQQQLNAKYWEQKV